MNFNQKGLGDITVFPLKRVESDVFYITEILCGHIWFDTVRISMCHTVDDIWLYKCPDLSFMQEVYIWLGGFCGKDWRTWI